MHIWGSGRCVRWVQDFILVRAECPYIQSSRACATDTIDDQSESRLEGGESAKPEIYKLKHALRLGVSVRVKLKLQREGKQINQEIRRVNTVICFTEVWF
jgi:hypothetical protein